MEKKPKAILFDWDNTLTDTWMILYHAMVETFKEMGHPIWTFEEMKARTGRSMHDLFPHLFGEDWQVAATHYQTYYRKYRYDYLKPIDKVENFLDLLANKDIYLAVVSNKLGQNLREEAEYLGWNKYFSKLVGSKDASEDKPSAAPVYLALEGSGIHPDNDHCWFVGDSLVDVECAIKSNCHPVFFGKKEKIAGHYDNINIFEDFEHIHNIVDKF